MRPEMPKQAIALSELVKQFETHCRLEGKPETTCRWYRDMLRRFLGWAGELNVEEFTIERVREYLAYAKDRPRYDGHPTTPSNGRAVSPCTFRHQAVTLRVFYRWLCDRRWRHRRRAGPNGNWPPASGERIGSGQLQGLIDPWRVDVRARLMWFLRDTEQCRDAK